MDRERETTTNEYGRLGRDIVWVGITAQTCTNPMRIIQKLLQIQCCPLSLAVSWGISHNTPLAIKPRQQAHQPKTKGEWGIGINAINVLWGLQEE